MLSTNNHVQGVSKVEVSSSLMTTITLPNNLNSLNSKLPKPDYE